MIGKEDLVMIMTSEKEDKQSDRFWGKWLMSNQLDRIKMIETLPIMDLLIVKNGGMMNSYLEDLTHELTFNWSGSTVAWCPRCEKDVNVKIHSCYTGDYSELEYDDGRISHYIRDTFEELGVDIL